MGSNHSFAKTRAENVKVGIKIKRISKEKSYGNNLDRKDAIK